MSQIIFADDFESSFIPWDGSIFTKFPDIVNTPVHHGSNAIRCNTINENVYVTFPATKKIFARAYVYFNTIPGAIEWGQMLSLEGPSETMKTMIYAPGGIMGVGLRHNVAVTITEAFAFTTGRWYAWTVKYDAEVNDFGIYIDDVRILTNNSVINQTVNQFTLGSYGNAWTNYDVVMDCVKLSEVYVGQEVENQPIIYEEDKISVQETTKLPSTSSGIARNYGSRVRTVRHLTPISPWTAS